MSFMDHLEELRRRIIYALIGIIIGAAICGVFTTQMIDILLLPAKSNNIPLQNLRPFGQVFLYFEVFLIGGLILSLPNFFFQFWKFISPALRKRERRYISAIVAFSTLCFIAGVVFAYYVMLPTAFGFAASFGTQDIKNEFAIDEYMSIILSVMVGAGLVFELPMISFFLSKLGILNPGIMRKYRRHAIVVILIAAALLTPGTDPVSQVVLAVPLTILYEISILVSKFSAKKT
ncbi:MAG: twin-arginine translocase subunit TatC [Ignavibacteriaceae bacterium]|nr:twin-arginine translocase subunit TatC [Ignavibacteriaceae bacterium]